MNHYPQSVLNLIRELSRLPGIGQKTAERLAMHLLQAKASETTALAESITAMKQTVRLCKRCFSLSDGDICRLCRNPQRDDGLLCVVEQPADMASLERSGAFNGLYHILGGVLSPMDGIGPDEIRIDPLVQRVRGGAVAEVVLATSTSVEGESTAAYIRERLRRFPVQVTRIASGVPIGGDLKYVDQVTLKRAMESRRKIDVP
ncbi:MAG: recombination mediator RecR [Desulfosarcinaceae bacterium]|nr:recombination mediator RecR [Desulfosarcinaceae bacterium]